MGSLGIWLGGALLVVCAVAVWLMKRAAEKAGREQAMREQNEAALSNALKATEIRGVVARMPDGTASDELHKTYSR